ncbi:MAG: thymidine phosphorylase [Endomicrobia bacterium]|nr:thymidine phosphorylase [Endomicrobiia bacterium]MCL2507081.1 thymidine phosphorylase [Endomicrobiia bacterium]
MRAYDIIYKKRNRSELSKQEIEFLVYRYNNGEIPDYQMSAFLMAVCFAGMTDEEIFNLTNAMANSGDILDLSRFDAPTADKHSTGGVGDGTSLIIAPIVAAAGIYVPMMVGRGLGHTGGTLDKLESIQGFRTSADKDEFLGFLKYAGAALTGQTNEIAPVDKKMYALRDVTATVESIPLICSSIMSKKIAEGAKTLVLDVKTGNGAFMKNHKDARELAEKMIAVGKKFKRNISAYVTDMDMPLGNCAGNSLEIKQAVEILKGNLKNDLSELSIELSAAMIFNSGSAASLEQAKGIAEKQLSSGNALEKFRQIIKTQGGNPKVLDNPDEILPKAKKSLKISVAKTGYVSYMKTRDIGIAAMMTGAGRAKKEDKIDYGAGVFFYKKTGEYVKEGETIAELFYNDASLIEEAAALMKESYIISEDKSERPKLIKEILN